ncbi:MAG: diaminopropionate ammonia-lyase, partial [Clostridium sp.]|nr:diaminopropionate ammonia-lyase [Clostridium sp.]
MGCFEYVLRKRGSRPEADLALTSADEVAKAKQFHSDIPGYAPTPLVERPALAGKLGVGQLWVKDESQRFGLNAFKALGGSYAMAGYLAGRLERQPDEVTFRELCSLETREKLGNVTFYTATDGNHGRGVAWSARLLGHKSVVYMPKGSALERLENIRAQGARAEITELNYDDAVRLADREAKTTGGVLIQDTAWPGYEEIPARIMQGYTTLAGEIMEQLDGQRPTHLFLQAGVGSFAGAVLGAFAAHWGADRPVTCIMEPDKADCLFRTARADDGQLHFVTGDMDSMMAGLCCGEPCTISWKIIDSYADGFISCADEYSALGMRLLGRAEAGDMPVVSGESGAVGAGVLSAIMTEDRLSDLRDALGLGPDSRVLLISTEGDTDQEN